MATKSLNLAKKLQILGEMELAPQNIGYLGAVKKRARRQKKPSAMMAFFLTAWALQRL